ncbi:MAG: hypothetical protein HN736_06000 [Anaerolineae bacterium]|nr:hypothetical protein [Anaerolineae bacterium]MBT3714017.1 hypothetical protein [Anaerolineae bacterium]MBT4312190.1 hypothetical protein [Anaerolineae bacterium]MBT4459907.1 hypothetical protein [Anaerolineae bacterium]MBT4841437.1 hypothetical protein [Anaerolineae bacterium]
MDITTILLYAHSGLRWLIVLAAFLSILFFGYGWLAKKKNAKIARILPAAYSGLVDTQVLLGIIVIILSLASGLSLARYKLEHISVMILVAVIGHLPARWSKSKKANLYRNTFLALLFSLVLVYLGVSVLPSGWRG